MDRIYQDDYASLLVSRNIGLDICESCYHEGFPSILIAEEKMNIKLATDMNISYFAGTAVRQLPKA